VAATNASSSRWGNPLGGKISKMTNALARLSEDFAHRTNVFAVLACILLAAGIFIIDVASLPLGVAAGVAYVAVVLISLYLPRWQYAIAVACGVSILTILGFLWSEPAGIPWMVVANRLLALATIWLTAIVGSWLVHSRRRNSEDALRMQHRAEQEADRARNVKSRFLETASNDLRHHLQTLSLLNGALRKVSKEPEAQKMFVLQGDALDHLSDLLNSLLEITKLDSGDVELEIMETPMPEIFRRLQDEFESQAQEKGLELHFDSQSVVAYSDRNLLTQILRIMLSNAIRYTPQGTVNVYCRREAGGLRVTVQDSGVGIAPDQLAGIFDEFYRVEKDPASRNGSLGLGLSIVERSANLLGTKVEVESEPGRGSSFSLVVSAGSMAGVQSAGSTK
jgi:signal transduction histidine kinase